MNLAEQTVVDRLDLDEQQTLLDTVREVVRFCPLSPMPGGMTVEITNAGPVGWWAHAVGRYEYLDRHPSGRPWAPMPQLWVDMFRRFASDPREPDCGHVVWYGPTARLGYHRDKTEADLSGSVVTIGLMGKDEDDRPLKARWGVERSDGVRTRTWLRSGDVTRLEGGTRNLQHSIERIEATDAPPEAAMLDLFGQNYEPPHAALDTHGRLVVSLRSGAGPR